MTTLARIRRGENGMPYQFRIISESGIEEDLTQYNLSESYINIKNPSDLSLELKLEGSENDISISSPNVIWKPTDSQTAQLLDYNYVCFVHLVNAATKLETISKHFLAVEDT